MVVCGLDRNDIMKGNIERVIVDPPIGYLEPENQRYLRTVMENLDANLSKTINKEIVLAGALERKARLPEKFDGEHIRGDWDEKVFFLNDDFVPKLFNPEKLSIKDIKQELKEKYEITLDGISYYDNIADFSSISVANVSTEEMFMKIRNMPKKRYDKMKTIKKVKNFSKIFTSKRRSENFIIADGIAAENKIKIPGLPDGYTRKQLTKWRKKNKFTWDEQLNGGYLLVPSVIHSCLAHTGLVSTSENAYKNLNKHYKMVKKHPQSVCWNESIAPITIGELQSYSQNKKRKGVQKNMKMSRSIDIDHPHNIDTVNKGALDAVNKIDGYNNLGEKYLAEKEMIEKQIEKVNNAEIPQVNKDSMIALLNSKMKEIQTEFYDNVEKKKQEQEEVLQEYIDAMREFEQGFNKQKEELEDMDFDASSVDVSDAIKDAEKNATTLNTMKTQYTEKLRLQMEQAQLQNTQIRNRRLSGRS